MVEKEKILHITGQEDVLNDLDVAVSWTCNLRVVRKTNLGASLKRGGETINLPVCEEGSFCGDKEYRVAKIYEGD